MRLVLGHLWALPHTLIGVVLMLTVYWPRRVQWRDGAVEVVVRWSLIPRGLGPSFVTGGQTHGAIMFYSSPPSDRLRRHEREHVRQCMTFGGIAYPLLYGAMFVAGIARGLSVVESYRAIWFERRARAAEVQP